MGDRKGENRDSPPSFRAIGFADAQDKNNNRQYEEKIMIRILLTNDDGVYAKGLSVLADTLSDIAQINVVAPDRNRSGSSNSLTLTVPLRVKYLENEMISVEGTPTDCVLLAVKRLLKDKRPTLVISGINGGANLGDDVTYSGTVAVPDALKPYMGGLEVIGGDV